MNSTTSMRVSARILILSFAVVCLVGPASAATTSARRTQSVQERLESCDPQVALSAANEVLSNPENLKEPLNLFMPAKILFDNGRKDDAVFWFYAAQLRTRYQIVFEKGDRPQLLSAMLVTVGTTINNYAFQDAARFTRTLDQVVAWDTRTANPFKERLSDKTSKEVEKIYADLRDFRANLAVNAGALQDEARKAAPGIQKAYTDATAAGRCSASASHH
jgi:hypothetical protein